MISEDVVKLDTKAADVNFESHDFLHPLSHISHLVSIVVTTCCLRRSTDYGVQFEHVSRDCIDNSPPRSQKRGVDDDQVTQSSDSQDLDTVTPSKKRRVLSLTSTPRRNLFPFCSSMEAQSPMKGGGDI